MFVEPALEEHLEETHNFNKLIEAYTATMPSFATPDGLAALRDRPSEFQGPDVSNVIERTIPGPAGEIPVRVVRPEDRSVRAVHLDLHGGGWSIGDAQAADFRNQHYADETGSVVVSANYRLAPEHPYPAGPDDAEAAAAWVLEHGEAEWGTARASIGGGSAGAHLTALSLIRLRDRLGADAVARFELAIFEAGCFDLGLTPSARASEDALMIPRSVTESCLGYFLPGLDAEARRSPEYSPLYADLRGLPPALFIVGTADPMLDDSAFMHARWLAAGNDAELAVYPDCVHGFTSMPTELAALARQRIYDFANARLG